MSKNEGLKCTMIFCYVFYHFSWRGPTTFEMLQKKWACPNKLTHGYYKLAKFQNPTHSPFRDIQIWSYVVIYLVAILNLSIFQGFSHFDLEEITSECCSCNIIELWLFPTQNFKFHENWTEIVAARALERGPILPREKVFWSFWL